MSRDLELELPWLYGIEAPPLVACAGAQVQPALVEPIQKMVQAAADAGFELVIASGYRNFERQMHIFNAKVQGERSVLDINGQALDPRALTEQALLHAILRWSALPGTSRHHWGTDFDIYDRSVCGDQYQLQLTLAECAGPMASFYRWLDQYLAGQTDFIRPYAEDRGGVAPEPWHLSFAPLSTLYRQRYQITELQPILASSKIALKPRVLAQLPDLCARYVV